MENTAKLYMVSFGDSDNYILKDTEQGEKSLLTRIERTLNNFLKKHFPQDSVAYFTSPKVTELSIEEESRYSGYPRLDKSVVEKIKKVLLREVNDMDSLKTLNRNAPFAAI